MFKVKGGTLPEFILNGQSSVKGLVFEGLIIAELMHAHAMQPLLLS